MSVNLKENILRAIEKTKLPNPDFKPPATSTKKPSAAFAEGNMPYLGLFQEVPGGEHYGWICPKCGAVMSPWIPQCLKCNEAQEIKISYNTETTGGDYIIAKNKSRCDKCAYELHCSHDRDEEGKCPRYKRDAPDGGYYG